jgi:hypothetical protein
MEGFSFARVGKDGHDNGSDSVPFTVAHTGGITTQNFDQKASGGQWVLHGRYAFNSGTGGHVEVSDLNGLAAADAVRFVLTP